MRSGFYPRLAADGIRKNKRMFLPYILTCVGMVMMFYIIMYLGVSPALDAVPGGDVMRSIFALGSWVIAIFSAIFLFYTNSFLIRRRKREFGLYNILGMGKGNIARILFWETLLTALIAVCTGLAAGIALSKLAELGLVNMMHGEITYDFTVPYVSVLRTAEVFAVIFALLLLNSVRQVSFSSAISLMRSESEGERPPKSNWAVGFLGLALLAAAYFIAVTVKDALSALITFFFAVVMVIIGTYLVMIAGSVTMCRILREKKSFYYRADHFVSVSSMMYRMKRNGAGLASICILATMVLVMISSTACLYFGEEMASRERYPRELSVTATVDDKNDTSLQLLAPVREAVLSVARDHGAKVKNVCDYRYLTATGLLMDNGEVETDPEAVESLSANLSGRITTFYFIPLADYNAMTGEKRALEDGQALIYRFRSDYGGDKLTFSQGLSLDIAGVLDNFSYTAASAMDLVPTVYLIVPDLYATMGRMVDGSSENIVKYLVLRWVFQFDTGLDAQGQIDLYRDLRAHLRDGGEKRMDFQNVSMGQIESREAERQDFYSLYGSLFYIGMILSIVFILAAVLIIYYKQVSEGYEDQARFGIMQKVGMTKREIRRSINSQLLTVFFLPLVMAVVHICFAFPIIRKLLMLFNLNNVTLFAATTAISVTVFAVFYAVVYKVTSNAYYTIVSGANPSAKA